MQNSLNEQDHLGQDDWWQDNWWQDDWVQDDWGRVIVLILMQTIRALFCAAGGGVDSEVAANENRCDQVDADGLRPGGWLFAHSVYLIHAVRIAICWQF